MKILVNTRQFREYVGQCLTASSSNHFAPILQSLYMKIDDKPFIMAFNGRIGVKIYVGDSVEVIEQGTCLIQGKKLLQILQMDKSEKIDISSVSNDRCVIKGDTSKYNVAVLDPAEYPSIDFNAEMAIEINTTEFRESVKILTPLICDDTSRPHMQGVLLDFIGEDWFLVVGDGKRMARIRFKNSGVVKSALPSWLLSEEIKTYRFLIPTDLLKCVMQMNVDPLLHIGFTQETGRAGQIIIRCGNMETKGVAMETPFADWVLPFKFYSEKFTSHLILNREEFDLAIKKSMIGATKEDKCLWFSTTDDGLQMTNRESEFLYSEVMPYVSSVRKSEAIEFCIDPEFAKESISTLPSETIKINYAGDYVGALLLECSEANFKAIIMLKKVKDGISKPNTANGG